jgi:hypothetical protein
MVHTSVDKAGSGIICSTSGIYVLLRDNGLGQRSHTDTSTLDVARLSEIFQYRVKPVACDETCQKICHFRKLWAAGGWNACNYQLLYNYRHLGYMASRPHLWLLGLPPVVRELQPQLDYSLKPGKG